MNSLGERIAYYRKKAGLTQEGLAEKCSVSAQAVSKWENDVTSPDIGLIAPLAQLFEITCDELLGAEKATKKIDPELVDLNKMLFKMKINSVKGDVVNINIPLSIADVVIKSGIIRDRDGQKIGDALKNIDLEQVVQLVRLGAVGKLMDIRSAAGDTVEVWVE